MFLSTIINRLQCDFKHYLFKQLVVIIQGVPKIV